MPDPKAVEQCDSCKFYRIRTYGTGPSARTVGECRVSEPTTTAGGWPQVKPDDWCGKYVVGP